MKTLYAALLALAFALAGHAQEELVDLDTIQRLAEQGNTDRAIDDLDRRIEADVNDVQSRFLKGLLLLEEDDTARARAVFAEITRLFPRLPEAYNNLAAIYAAEGDYENARQRLLNAIANAPEYAPVRTNLGDLYSKLALDAYRRALELDPGDEAAEARLQWLEQMFAAAGE